MTKQRKKKKIKLLQKKPRNFLVPLAAKRKAGKHKCKKRQAKQEDFRDEEFQR